jgi:hypothetical protein
MISLTAQPVDARLRLILLLPFIVLVGSSAVLAIAALLASGAAEEVRYPDNLPVYAGLLAAMPSTIFGLAAITVVWKRTADRFQVRTTRLLFGLIVVASAVAMLLAYAFIVGDPDHYKGDFNNAAQEWDPRVPTAGSYLALIAGVATFFPMGALAFLAKYLYIDAIEPGQLDRPEGRDPIGSIMSGR